MTTEEDFQAMLDAHPDDHHTRGVFGDWLCDRGDPRGPGYQELARLAVIPWRREPGDTYPRQHYGFTHVGNSSYHRSLLPVVWHEILRRRIESSPVANGKEYEWETWSWWVFGPTRRAVEDAAALAFTPDSEG